MSFLNVQSALMLQGDTLELLTELCCFCQLMNEGYQPM